jgi:hypothetical protein
MSISVSGILVKIDYQKKLLIEIDKEQYDLFEYCKNMKNSNFKVWLIERYDDHIYTIKYFINVTLDPREYDICNLHKFEILFGSRVSIQGTFKTWDILPIGEVFRDYFLLSSIEDSEIDEIADRAAARITSPPEQMTELELSIDADVDVQVAKNLGFLKQVKHYFTHKRQNAYSRVATEDE